MKNTKIQVALLALLMLSGCVKAGDAGFRPIPDQNKQFPERMQLYCYDSFRDGLVPDSEAKEDWISYMESLYPMDITVSNDIYPCYYSNDFGTSTTGLACLPGKHILPLIKGDMLLPLEDYLKDNAVWKSLPEDFKKQFELDGHIWAIPYSDQSTLKIGSIRTDWLKAVGMKVPTTPSELIEVGKAFANGDPNGNGIADDYLMGGLPSTGFCPQILNSFGFYIDSEQLTVTYDPIEGCIVDCMFKPEAKEALQFIRDMITGGMIDPLSFTNPAAAEEKSSNGEYGIVNASIIDGKYTTGIRWTKANAQKVLGRPYDPENEEDYIYATSLYQALPLFESNYPVTYQSSLSGYTMSVGTPQPKETINAFVNMIFGSRDTFLEWYIGNPAHYTVSNNIITVKYKDEEKKAPYIAANLINLPSMTFSEDYMIIYPDNSATLNLQSLAAERLSDRVAYESNYLNKYSKGQLAQISVYYEVGGQAYEMGSGRTVYERFRRAMNELNNPNKSVEDIIQAYKDYTCYFLEGMLAECNSNMGLENKQNIYQ